MAFDSTADLLFTISGDSTAGQAALAQFRESLASTAGASKATSAALLYDWAGNPIQGLAGDFGALAPAAEQAGARMVGSSREAREAIRGLGEEVGVHMPRFVGSWLASLGPVSGIMGAAFAPIAVVGLVEIIGKLPGALHSGVLALEGFGEAQQKVFDEGVKQSIARDEYILEYAKRIRAISLIGKDGMDRINESLVVQSGNFRDIDDLLLRYLQRQQQLKDVVNYKSPTPEGVGGLNLTGEATGAKTDPNAPTLADIQRAKQELAQIEPEILKLQKSLQDLRAEDMETSALAKAQAAQDAAEAEKERARHLAEQERQTSELASKQFEMNGRWLEGMIREAAEEQRIDEQRERQSDELESKYHEGNVRWLEELIRSGAEKAKAQQDANDAFLRQQEDFENDLARVAEETYRIQHKDDTTADRIKGQYAADVARFKAAEDEKTADTRLSEEQRAAIRAEYAGVQEALLQREQTDLQALKNSQGWQGLFGNEFAEGIKRNEALTKEWAESTNQSAMLVRVTLESLKETTQDAFKSMATAEAASVMHAVVYGKSVKAAMEEAAKAQLASLAEQAAVKAIFATAEGFFDLATGNEPGAAAAFTSAALFGSVAAAAAIAGRAIPNAQSGGAGSGGGGGSDRSSSGSRGSGGSYTPAQGTAADSGRAPAVTVHVYGNYYGTGGVSQLAADLSDAVLNGGTPLTATNTKTGVQVTQ